MEAFLKDTIPGIVLLGAFGSFLAAGAIWSAKKLISIFVPRLYQYAVRLFVRCLIFLMKSGMKSQAELYLENNQNKLDAYHSCQKSKITIFMTFSTWVFIWLLFRINIQDLAPFSVEAVSYISLIFLLQGFAFSAYLSLMVPLMVNLDRIFEEVIDALEPKDRAAFEAYKANK
ncbi:Uncharacterised protein [BD1-7 clade bacterium]|uniref:Uncharacterized protein n=1 Tax=BD1-7 clade bacterium TaxID=2029982 RepID=A0A5S9Q8H7_9GAMM|nr:Uncharacterised protein [BD1-7 clade bacterium]